MKLECRPCETTRITSLYDISRVNPVTGKLSPHYGIDLAPKKKRQEPIYATHSGIAYCGYNSISGNYVKITDVNGDSTWYCHLSGINVKNRAKVQAGTVIGRMGSTGRSTGEHLHFGVKVGGRWVNPEPLLRGLKSPQETEAEMVYNSVNQLKGDWKEAVEWALKQGILKGNGSGLGLTESEIKGIVFLYRYDQKK